MTASMWSGNLERWPTWSLDPPPLGERECMDFLKKSYGSQLLDGVRQSTCWPTGILDPLPLGERECMDFLRKSEESELLNEVR